MKVFAIANQKGGVGKTSIAVNLSATLAHYGQRALLIDLDPQGNATTGSGIDKSGVEKTRYGVLLGEYGVEGGRVGDEGQYDVLRTNRDLDGADIELIDIDECGDRLKRARGPIAGA